MSNKAHTLCIEAAELFEAQGDEWGRIALAFSDTERRARCRAIGNAAKHMAQRLREAALYRVWLRGYLIGALTNDDSILRERIESLRDDLTPEGE